MNETRFVFQFKITLLHIEPEIWRRIQVPATYNFWDLHVALANVMGWLDYHLHLFYVKRKHKRAATKIGIPDYGFDDGWEHECPPEDCVGVAFG